MVGLDRAMVIASIMVGCVAAMRGLCMENKQSAGEAEREAETVLLPKTCRQAALFSEGMNNSFRYFSTLVQEPAVFEAHRLCWRDLGARCRPRRRTAGCRWSVLKTFVK
ncbi:hypothetical protein H4582DRAFT_1994897 [Lactarius indigo]|nr:hypothetical protein H4582DRAFT_1994897 [Lactarius indigo]